MAGLLVVRSRKVSAERQKGQVQGGSPNCGEGGTRGALVTSDACACFISPYQTPPVLGRGGDALRELLGLILNA